MTSTHPGQDQTLDALFDQLAPHEERYSALLSRRIQSSAARARQIEAEMAVVEALMRPIKAAINARHVELGDRPIYDDVD